MKRRVVLLTFCLVACGGKDRDKQRDADDSGTDDTSDSGDTGDTSDTGDSGTNPCEAQGYATVEFVDAGSSTDMYATAADFTVETAAGDWNFKEHWTGCDTFLLIQDRPRQNSSWDTLLWQRDVADLFEQLPKNVHLLLMSADGNEKDRATSMELARTEVAEALADMDAEEAAWWEARVAFVTTRDRDIEGWPGDLMQNPGWGVGIDRFQRIRYIGSYADPLRYDSDVGWFKPNLSMAANEAIHYNYEAEREAALEADAATVVTVFGGDRVAGSTSATVELPSSDEMALFDTLTVDLTMACEGDGEYGDCPAWDYMAYLFQCDMPVEDNPYAGEACQPYVAGTTGTCYQDGVATSTTCSSVDDCLDGSPTTWTCEGAAAAIPADTKAGTCREPGGGEVAATYSCNDAGTGYDDVECACDTEVGRWITTYHREGRWVHDVSGLLPLLGAGGEQTFRFDTNGPYELDLDLRFST